MMFSVEYKMRKQARTNQSNFLFATLLSHAWYSEFGLHRLQLHAEIANTALIKLAFSVSARSSDVKKGWKEESIAWLIALPLGRCVRRTTITWFVPKEIPMVPHTSTPASSSHHWGILFAIPMLCHLSSEQSRIIMWLPKIHWNFWTENPNKFQWPQQGVAV